MAAVSRPGSEPAGDLPYIARVWATIRESCPVQPNRDGNQMNESELIDRLPAAVREEFEGICSEIEGLKRERDVLAQQVSQNEADTNSFTGARAVLLRTAAVFIEMQGPVVQTAMMPRHFNDASVPAAPIERGERADIRGAVLNFVRDAQRAVSVDEIVRAVAGN